MAKVVGSKDEGPNSGSDWRNDAELGRVSARSKDRIEALFDLDDRAVSIGYVVHGLRIDFDTVKRVLDVMTKHGFLEKIPTNSQPVYRRVPADSKPSGDEQ